jgi:hypothetical protein
MARSFWAGAGPLRMSLAYMVKQGLRVDGYGAAVSHSAAGSSSA